jgi:hypothetical protein
MFGKDTAINLIGKQKKASRLGDALNLLLF